ncbi:MAG TPA: thioredoxin domain-containing protein [Pirellulaceae bacterium]|nr:thioredoxin domain-containing protein [Pirellulaceae bacterium]
MTPLRLQLILAAAIGLSANLATLADEPPKPADKAKPKHTNRLAKETSPYLLQHAHNPVDWHPWGEEALAKAKKDGKLIFLSIGYSSCHWCHVMERESFMDEEIAKFMNEHFVCIKVDREERPDVDSIYMTSLYTYNRLAETRAGGGWPLSMFLTPDGEPFFGGTYFPARDGDRGAATGFLTIIQRVHQVWKEKPDNIKDDAKVIVKYTKAELEGARKAVLTEINEALYLGVLPELAGQFDEQHGGFGYVEEQPQRPKFPEPSNLVYLIDIVRRYADSPDAERKTQAETARKMLVATLEKMSLGGIRDHLGGGFHRYSTDRFWRIPHFEKMLYDNGQLASVYAQAFELTQRTDFERVCRELCDFVLREMTDKTGGFYAAIDADSEHEEGKFYRWEKDEFLKLLSAEEVELFSKVYGLTEEPNFEEKFYVPQLARPLKEIAAGMKTTEAELEKQLVPIRAKLLAARSKRVRPLTDTKILTADNGLMIGGLADAGRILKEPRYIAAAEKAAAFVLANLRTKEGRLLRTHSGGQAKLNAYLNDYAYLADGLIRLHRASGDKKWLAAADEITARQLEFFADEAGGFFFTSKDHETLFARAKDPVDGASPAGSSISALNLLTLARELEKPDYVKHARGTIESVAAILESSPTATPLMATAVPRLLEANE